MEVTGVTKIETSGMLNILIQTTMWDTLNIIVYITCKVNTYTSIRME